MAARLRRETILAIRELAERFRFGMRRHAATCLRNPKRANKRILHGKPTIT